ncbi:hypothetical protein KAS50_01660, partial [bacterium]|nr:hypothetical protein [bacterium]
MMRLFLFILLLSITILIGSCESETSQKINRDIELNSLKPDEVLSVLDLDKPELEPVKAASVKGDRLGALTALLKHYRNKYPISEVSKTDQKKDFKTADNTVNHIFQWGPYEPADYGDDINWEWNPAGDIEWVAAVYRFYWALPLEEAYKATGDEKYARAFVELASDWIAKHPLEKRKMIHPIYTRWRGFPWLDIQTGIRATYICRVFKTFIHAEAF